MTLACLAAPLALAQDPTAQSGAPQKGGTAGAPKGTPSTTGNSGALTAGGAANTGGPHPESLTAALKACEKLSGSAAAKCQEQALSEHPGEW